MKIFQTIKTSTPGTALETIPGLEVPALPEKIAKIDQAGSNDFQAKLGESFMKFREALILALRDPTSLGLGGDTKAAAGLPSLIPISLIQESSTLKVMTSSERNKLAGIETGAQVNTVTSVQGRIGSVVVNASDVGLGDVDNTSDMNKPVSTAQATAINARLPKLTYVGVSMNGTTLTASVGKMYGIYATGVTITLPSATSIGDGEVIGFVIGVNASRTLQINTTANQDLVTPDGVKTTGYAVTGFARTVYAVCYFHTWMLCGLEDSAIDAAVSDMMTQSTNQYVTGVKTFKVPFITSPDGTANYSVFSFGSNPGGLVWYLQYKPTNKEANWFTTKGGLFPIVMKMVYNPNPRVEFPVSPTVPTVDSSDNSTLAASTAFVQAQKADTALTGTPTAPTAAAGTNTTQIATTAFVSGALAGKAPLANPEFTGTPTAPTLLTKPTSANLWVIYNPPGAGYVGGSGASQLSDGIIEIKLPSPGSGKAFIAQMQIEVFDYSFQQSYTVITEGFWQTTNQWTRQSSQVLFPQGTVKKEVVVGHGIAADGRPVIQLETLATTRAYLRVSIPWVMISWIADPAPFLNQWAIATIRDSNPSTIHSTRTCYPGLNAETTQTINGRQFFRNAQGNVMYGPLTPAAHDPLCFGCGDTLMWKFRQETSGTLAFYHWDGSAFSKAAEWNPSTKSMDLLNQPTAPTQAAGTNNTRIATTAFVQAATARAIYDLPVTRSGLVSSGTDSIIFETANAIDPSWYDTTHVLNVSFFARNNSGLNNNTTFKLQLYDEDNSTAYTIASITADTLNYQLFQASIYRASSSSVNCNIQYGAVSTAGYVSLAAGSYKLRVVCTSTLSTVFGAAQVRFTK